MPTKKPIKTIKKPVSIPAKNVKKPVVITAKNQKTIASAPKEVRVDTSKLSKNKKFQELLDDAITGIEIDTDDLDDDMLEAWEEFDDELRPKLAKKNWALWAAIFSPVILPGIVKGMRSEPTVPQPKVIIKGRQQEVVPPVEPRKIVNYCSKYFQNHGLSLCKSLTETDLSRLKDDLKQNWDKGPDAFAEAFKKSYPVSKSRLEMIYKNERHQAEYSGVLERAKNADHSYKRWETIGDERTCDICLAMDGEIVPINEKFSNGQMIPSAHVNCRCSMTSYSEEDYDDLPDEYIRQDAAYLNDVAEFLRLNSKCKRGTVDESNKCNPDQDNTSINLNPDISPKDYDAYEKYYQAILKDKSEPDRVMRRLNAETLERKFYRITKDSLNENKLNNDKHIMEHGNKLWNSLSKESRGALKEYTSHDYGVINSALQEDIVRDEVRYLKEATSHPLGFSTILYRGISFKLPNEIYKNGSEWVHKPFGSCSTGQFIAEEAATGKLTHVDSETPTILEIFTDPETKGFAIGKNSFHSGADAGSEVILDSGTRFKTIHSEKQGKMRILTVRVLHDKKKQDASYLSDVANQMKLNYKCPEGSHDEGFGCGGEEKKSFQKNTIEPLYSDYEPPEESTEDINNAEELFDSASEYERDAIDGWSRGDYSEINEAIFNKYLTNDIKHKIENIDSVLSRSTISQDTVLYSGISKHSFDNILSMIKNDNKLIYPGYMSTSDDRNEANSFSESKDGKDLLIRIECVPGIEALKLTNTWSRFSDEKEYLVGRNQTFLFKGIIENEDARYINLQFQLNNKSKQNASYLSEVTNFIKLNYKCKKEDSPDGSNKCTLDKEHTNIDTKSDVISQVKNTKTFTDVVSGKLLPSKLDNIGIELAKEYGLDKPPISVSESELDNIIESGSKEITRIVTSNEYVKEFTQQEKLHMSNGLYGTGIYTAYKQGVPQIEDNFHKATNTKLYKIRMAIDNTANIITIDNITSEIRNQLSLIEELSTNSRRNIDNQIDKLITNYGDNEKEIKKIISTGEFNNKIFAAMRILISDPGIYAILKGYDAIDIPDHEYLLVLNRNKLYVQRDTATQNSAYLQEAATYLILSKAAQKLNANCKKEEKIGEGPGSCGGGKVDSNASQETYVGFKADHDFSSKQDREANMKVQAVLDRAAEPLKKASKEDIITLRKYSSTTFTSINQYLNGSLEKNYGKDNIIIKNVKKEVESMDRLFSEADLQDPLITYRGVKDNIMVKHPELRDALDTPGSEVQFPCFTSTSALPFQANRFADGYSGRLLELQLPKGTKALFIAEESGVPQEFEVLVNRGIKFEVGETRYTDVTTPEKGKKIVNRIKITTIKAIA
ncbi:ADP-ribosyltransferase [Bacteroides sp.]|uniref:ADP-ribosyltransferase n=1 Tax=Bacteroides sp. TaxID=29523 RepID=UPI0026079138|nr:ADP-ribosyltransferase [Bacteroides sp.]MDD3040769.1 ADP-ribosyltransferase [Bacteroides sp.]